MKYMLKKYNSLILMAAISLLAFTADAFIVNSVTGNVKISSGGKISAAVKGDTLSKNDKISIPAGGLIKIFDETTSKEYTSVANGNMTVGELIAKSAENAKNNAAQINAIVNFPGQREKVAVGSRVHREKGMVTRSLNLFDEEGAAIEISPEALAQLIAYTVYFGKETCDSILRFTAFPNNYTQPYDSMNEFGFRLNNPLETPLYFNVLQFSGIVERKAEISSLGQPGGCYILPPGHTMWRTRNDEVPYGEKHVVVACHYSFDIDPLIEALNTIINDPNLITNFPDTTLPVFIKQI